MREIEVTAWCDGPHQERVRAVEDHTITIDNMKPRLVDVCQHCRDEIVDPLIRLLGEGAVVKGGESKRSYSCPVCNFSSPTPQGLGRHAKAIHDATVRELRNTGVSS